MALQDDDKPSWKETFDLASALYEPITQTLVETIPNYVAKAMIDHTPDPSFNPYDIARKNPDFFTKHPYLIDDYKSGRILDFHNQTEFTLYSLQQKRDWDMRHRLDQAGFTKTLIAGAPMQIVSAALVSMATGGTGAGSAVARIGGWARQGGRLARFAKGAAIAGSANTIQEAALFLGNPDRNVDERLEFGMAFMGGALLGGGFNTVGRKVKPNEFKLFGGTADSVAVPVTKENPAGELWRLKNKAGDILFETPNVEDLILESTTRLSNIPTGKARYALVRLGMAARLGSSPLEKIRLVGRALVEDVLPAIGSNKTHYSGTEAVHLLEGRLRARMQGVVLDNLHKWVGVQGKKLNRKNQTEFFELVGRAVRDVDDTATDEAVIAVRDFVRKEQKDLLNRARKYGLPGFEELEDNPGYLMRIMSATKLRHKISDVGLENVEHVLQQAILDDPITNLTEEESLAIAKGYIDNILAREYNGVDFTRPQYLNDRAELEKALRRHNITPSRIEKIIGSMPQEQHNLIPRGRHRVSMNENFQTVVRVGDVDVPVRLDELLENDAITLLQRYHRQMNGAIAEWNLRKALSPAKQTTIQDVAQRPLTKAEVEAQQVASESVLQQENRLALEESESPPGGPLFDTRSNGPEAARPTGKQPTAWRTGRERNVLETEILDEYITHGPGEPIGTARQRASDAIAGGEQYGFDAMHTDFYNKIPAELVEALEGHPDRIKLRRLISIKKTTNTQGEDVLAKLGTDEFVSRLEQIAGSEKLEIAKRIDEAAVFAKSTGNLELYNKIQRYKSLKAMWEGKVKPGHADFENYYKTPQELTAEGLKPGDKFEVEGETFVVQQSDQTGYVKVKDGITGYLPEDSVIKIDEGSLIKKAGKVDNIAQVESDAIANHQRQIDLAEMNRANAEFDEKTMPLDMDWGEYVEGGATPSITETIERPGEPEVSRVLTWEEIMSNLFDEARRDPAIGFKHQAKIQRDIKRLTLGREILLGRPIGWGANHPQASKWLRRLRKISHMRIGGMFGLAQILEFFNIAGEMTWRSLADSVPTIKDIIKSAKDGKLTNETLRELQVMTGAGTDPIARRFGDMLNRLQDSSQGDMFVDPSRLDHLLDSGVNLTNTVSLFHLIDYSEQLLAARVAAQNLVEAAFDARLPNPKRLAAIGLSPEKAKRVFAQIREFAEAQRGHIGTKYHKINIEKWTDQQAAADLVVGISKWANRTVQRNNPGQMMSWMTGDIGRTIMQFRTFTFAAWEKQFLHGVYVRDFKTAVSWLGSMFLGGLSYTALQYVNATSRKDRDKYLAKRLTPKAIALGAFQRAGFSSLIPTAADSVLGLTPMGTQFNYSRTTGQTVGLVDMAANPTTDLVDRVTRLATLPVEMFADKERRLTQGDYYNAKSLLPLQNAIPVAQLLRLIGTDLPRTRLPYKVSRERNHDK